MTDLDYSALETVGALQDFGYQVRSIKDEMRANLMRKLKTGEVLFPGIIGYDDTVIPELENAILSRHDIILLGLRGQAKTRVLRSLVNLLDDRIPIVKGCEVNSSPFDPISKFAADQLEAHGNDTPIEWIARESRYGEKLATPDVTIADLIGDIDPIKAASLRLHYAHEGVIHFGIVPRMNRGIFAINELPDLQPRIQVGLLNIMEEKDIQIRGFPVRIPLDLMIVFSANPEDYTNRGSIITPLKDRIDSQILTHYPQDREHAMAITNQEAWIERDSPALITTPDFVREILEEVAFQARTSEFIDQKSGVSTRLSIAAMENMISNVEKRSTILSASEATVRICDLIAAVPAMTGKLELVYEGEQEGAGKVSELLIGRAVKEVFRQHFPDAYEASETEAGPETPYQDILAWFESNNTTKVSDMMDDGAYFESLNRVPGLKDLAVSHMNPGSNDSLAVSMEFILEGLHQNSRLSKHDVNGTTSYSDMMGSIFEN